MLLSTNWLESICLGQKSSSIMMCKIGPYTFNRSWAVVRVQEVLSVIGTEYFKPDIQKGTVVAPQWQKTYKKYNV